MSTDRTKKGAAAGTATPRKHEATDLLRVTPEPRRHEGSAALRLRRSCGEAHPIDAANAFAATFEHSDRTTMLLALRDLAIALRREGGQKRRTAQTEVDAVLGTFGPEDDLRNAIANFAALLAECWTPQPWPPLRLLGIQWFEVEQVMA